MMQAIATAQAQQEEIKRLEEFVARFGAKASKATQAQSRMKQLEKLKKSAIEVPAASAAIGPGDARKVSLTLPRAPPCNQKVRLRKGGSCRPCKPAHSAKVPPCRFCAGHGLQGRCRWVAGPQSAAAR